MLQAQTEINKDDLRRLGQQCKDDGWRLVTISAVDLGERVELIYHFDKDLALKHLRLTVGPQETAPSLSPVYLAAFLAENEIRDQFGLAFQGLAIDYQGYLFLEPGVECEAICHGASARLVGADAKEDE